MNAYSEQLIGFDAREDFLTFTGIWDTHRIKQYLLTKSVIKPLSVDVMVWDSIFHVLHVQRPNWVGPRQEMWENLERLRAFIAAKNIRSSYWIMAATQWVTVGTKNAIENPDDVKITSVPHGWNLLGFDVADNFLLSGLMNAGYRVEERDALTQQWARYLNQYHLFDNLDTALQFKVLTNERVREHSPFNVYGIYLIEKVTAHTESG